MDSIVAFFERLVTEFSWRRLGLVVAAVVALAILAWVYESLTGRFRASRMQFAVEQLVKLSDPSLKANVDNDDDLKKAYKKAKDDLNEFLKSTKLKFGIPQPALRGIAAVIPWVLLGFFVIGFSTKSDYRSTLGGMFVVALPCIILAMLIPTFSRSWINYVVIPFGSVVVVMVAILVWHTRKMAAQR